MDPTSTGAKPPSGQSEVDWWATPTGCISILVVGVVLVVGLVGLFVWAAKKDYEEAVDRQIKILQTGDAVARAKAIMELASEERREAKRAVPAVPYLIANLPDETRLQWRVVYGGGPIGTPQSFATDKFTTPGKEAAETLLTIGPPAIPQLIEAMAHRIDLRMPVERVAGQNPLQQAKAAELVAGVLVKIGQPAVEPLTKALDDPRWGVRAGAAETLGLLGDKSAVPALAAKLTDPEQPVRRTAAEALGRLGDERALEPLVAALNDQDEFVVDACVQALAELSDPRAIEPLIAAFKRQPYAGPEVKIALAKIIRAKGLGTISENDSVFWQGDPEKLRAWWKTNRRDAPGPRNPAPR